MDRDDGDHFAWRRFAMGGTYRTPWWAPWLYIVPTLVAGVCAWLLGPYQGWAAVPAAVVAAVVTWIFLNLLGWVVAWLSTSSSFMRAQRDMRRFRRRYTTE